MSRKLIIPILILFQLSLRADVIEIPEVIKKNFEELFPGVRSVKWETIGANQFEAGFTLNGKEVVAVFMNDGTFKEIETEIHTKEVPVRVQKAVLKKFPLSKITYAVKVERKNNVIVYDLEVDTGIERLDITLNSMGYEVD